MAAPQITLKDPGEWLKGQPPAQKPLTDPGVWLDAQSQPPQDHAVREHLKDEGFLDSLWNVVKSPVSMVSSIFNGDFAKEGSDQRKRMDELERSGTPEQKREFAKEIVLKNIPFASTAYKIKSGNYGGALGDAAGIVALGGLSKGAEAVSDIPVARIAKTALEGGKGAALNLPLVGKPVRAAIRSGTAAWRDSAPVAAPAAPVPPTGFGIASGSTVEPTTPTAAMVSRPTSGYQPPVSGALPGAAPEVMAQPVSAVSPALETLAKQSGFPSFADAPPEAQAFLRNYAAQPTSPIPASAPTAPMVSQPTAAVKPSIPVAQQLAQELAAEIAARKAAQVPPVAPAEMPPVGPQAAPTTQAPETASVPPAPAKSFADMTRPELEKALGLPDNASPAQIAKALRDEVAVPQVAPAPNGAPDPTPLADLMREIPQGTRKAVAKANYRAVKEGAASQESASPTYEAANRAIKVHPVVQAILDHGVTYDDMTKLTKVEIQSLADQLSKATAAEGKQHPGHPFSALSVDELMGQLRMAQGGAKPLTEAAPAVQDEPALVGKKRAKREAALRAAKESAALKQ